jgi:hypothetical protein
VPEISAVKEVATFTVVVLGPTISTPKKDEVVGPEVSLAPIRPSITQFDATSQPSTIELYPFSDSGK